jgi:hypothetical protein
MMIQNLQQDLATQKIWLNSDKQEMAHNNRAGECYLLKPLIVSSKKVVDTTIKMQGNVEIQL